MLLRKHLLFIAFAILLLSPSMSCSAAVSMYPLSDISLDSGVSVYFSGTMLRVTGGFNLTLSIYSITGTRVMCQKIEGDDKSWNLNLQRGCYIVKVGNVVRKIAIA